MEAREFMCACRSHLISVSALNILSMFAANAECLASELMVTFLWKFLYINEVLFCVKLENNECKCDLCLSDSNICGPVGKDSKGLYTLGVLLYGKM